MTTDDVRAAGRAIGPGPRALRPALRHGADPAPRLRRYQRVDGLPRAQEQRAETPLETLDCWRAVTSGPAARENRTTCLNSVFG